MIPAGILNSFLFRRRPRALLLLGAFFLLTTITTPGPAPRLGSPMVAALTASPVRLNENDPSVRRIGALIFRRGWALSSPNPRFGGLSAMQVEGGRVLAISDDGYLFQFALPGAGPSQVAITPMRAGPGDRDSKFNRDTEAMLVEGDRVWLAYERHNMIWRHRRPGWDAEAAARPPLMRRWGRNSGAEAMTRLADGRVLIFAEGGGGAFSPVAMFDGDPADTATRAVGLRIRRLPGFRVTDVDVLPDGRLLILSRQFDWMTGFSAKLAIADANQLRDGATIEPREIAHFAPPLIVDNFEALSVAREGGRTIVRIASDDNFLRLQRTLLLEFELSRLP
jgi:hypothetical protein